MKTSQIFRTLWMFILFPIILWASAEQEVLVLSKPNFLQMPDGRDSADVDEITAPQVVIDCLQNIGAVMIIKALPNFYPADTYRITEDGTIARLPNFSHLYRIVIPLATNLDSVICRLTSIDGVLHVEINQPVYYRTTTVNDPKFNEQWNFNDPIGHVGLNIMKAWDLSCGSSSIKIGIVDTGIDSLNYDLRGNVTLDGDLPYLDPVSHLDNFHGTFVAGIVGAQTNNNTGVAGINWYVKIHSERIEGTNVSAAIEAIIGAVNKGCKVINCSWAIPSWSDLLYSTFLWVYQCNVLPIAAVAADYSPYEHPEKFGPWMCNIAATTLGDASNWNPPAPYSLKLPWVDMAAPGGEYATNKRIISTWFGGYYYGNTSFRSTYGTSAAAPHAAGVAGLLLSANPGLKNYELEWIMKLSAKDIAPPNVDSLTGYGIIDAYEAVRHVILPYEFLRGDVTFTEYDPVYRTFTNPIIPYDEPAGYYKCKMVVADIWLNFDYVESPWAFLSLEGFSNTDPNDGTYWMRRNVNPVAAHLTTCFYYLYDRWVRFPPHWTSVNKWVPVDPYFIAMRYTIIGCKSITVPTNLQATAQPGGHSIKLTWNDNSHNELKFIIERRIEGGPFEPYDSVGQNIKQYIDNNTTSGQTYGYQVYAKAQEFKSGYSNADYATAGLAAPTLNPVIDMPPNQAKVSWQNNAIVSPITYTLSRWDDNIWNDDYQTGLTNTFFIDNVEFLHKYKYRVLAKDAAGHTSDWSNIIEYSSGLLAQSNYPKMSAYNCNQKVVMSPDGKIHLISFNGQDVFYALSPDGYNFSTWKWLNYPEFTVDTIPALAIDNSGIPHIVFGERVQSKVTYYVRDTSSSFPDMIYQSAITSANPYPPSFIWAGDTGWIVFKDPDSRVVVARYPPPFVQVITPPIDGGNPVIGYDRGSVGQLGRLVVLVHNEGYGPLTLYWRQIGSAAWNSVDIPSQYSAYGAPSLWTGANEIRMTFEGWETAQQGALFFLKIPWQNNTYDMIQPIELISTNFDYDEINGLEGYSYLPSQDVVLWKYQDDIYWSQRIGPNYWSTPQNISSTPTDISSYPQGIVSGSFLRQKLFALWTEKVGDAYYLVHKTINIPSAYPVVHTVTQVDIPEATAYNNSRRVLRDKNHVLHLVYTDAENVYHTFLKDTAWSAPQLIGEGKYPALSRADNGTLYCTWCYNGYQDFNGDTVYVEYLMMSSNNGSSWSDPAILYHTYGSFLWGVGAPSLAIKDTTAYVVFKTYHGPTYHPPPGGPTLPVIILDGPALIYGKFSINHPEFSYRMLDAINWANPIPTDTSIYPDSMVPLLVSPSIAVDQNNIPHVLWEGDSTAVRYYTVNPDTVIRELFDNHSAFPSLAMNGDRIDLFWTSRDSIRYRYGWTGTTNLSQTQTVATCESPISSGQYLTWTKRKNGISHLYYGAIPASGAIEPIEINYATDLIAYPQILFNPKPLSLDFVWTEFNPAESLGYIYYLNLPIDNPAPAYGLDMGTDIPVPVLVHRDGYQALGGEDYQTFDYDSTELTYRITLHSLHEKYKIRWTYYHQEPNKVKLQFNIDDILHRNCWVNPGEKVTEEDWIPQSCLEDNEITVKVEKLSGTIAVLSGIEIFVEAVGSGGGPQGDETQISRPFFLENMYPNPARGILKVRFNSPDERIVTVKLYDVTGRLVENVFNGKARIGMNEINIKPSDLSNGIYFILIESGNFNKTVKFIYLK